MRPEYKRELRANEQIKIPKLRVIGSDGKQVGVLTREEALRMAREEGLDLVEVVPNTMPPVCKIMDYGKYKYEKSKTEKHKHKPSVVKEIKLGLNIQDADMEVKLRWAKEFLAHGNRVRARLQFRGREIIYSKRGKDVLWRFAQSLEDIGIVEQAPRIDGNIATVVVAPTSKSHLDVNRKKRDAKTQDQ